MAFPPDFLEELRRRVALSSVVGRRVRLARKGRELEGLCPFHQEKTPSFFVNDDKAFYHCFGCGAHGDVISFIINTEGLSFPETVERLAEEAGLPVPKGTVATPEERQRRQSGEAAMAAAAVFFETELRKPGGAAALDYLKRRGLGEADIGRFQLGYAPDSRTALRQHLTAQGFEEPLLVEMGLLIKPDDGGPAYDRFRGRAMFPIADRRGRVIAFGGRVMGDGQPKYLNSPETPLFHKGRTLYAHHLAREAAASAREVIVVEGYMDVVALHKAGFTTAVAPLGTALTEEQLGELWRIAAEPYLCFDGDKAGQRAAARAAERALPLLEPGRSLRFVLLPEGQDPDDLVRQPGGRQLFRDLMIGARPLADMLWEQALATHRIDTPERRAEFRRHLRTMITGIADNDVRSFYGADFAERQRRLFDSGAPQRQPWAPRPRFNRFEAPSERLRKPAPATLDAETLIERSDVRVFLAAMLNHRPLADDFHEVLAEVSFADPLLDRLRAGIVNAIAAEPSLDSSGLQNQLVESGHDMAVSAVLSQELARRFAFVRPDASLDEARKRCGVLLARIIDLRLKIERREAERRVVEAETPEAWEQFRALYKERAEAEGLLDEDGASGKL